MIKKKIIQEVDSYYTNKIEIHGAVPAGVDWNSYESQALRFEQLLKVIDGNSEFTILDYGCGYGAFFEYLRSIYNEFDYTGYDISEKMIMTAQDKYREENTNWTTKISKLYDYVVASGLFNVRLSNSDQEWFDYLIMVLEELNKVALNGFSFNLLTKYSDDDKLRDYLYYADPLILFDYCKRNFSKNVSLLHDYQLYEFTIIVRK